MREIQLARSELVTMVDDADYDEMSKYRWFARAGGSGAPYVARSQNIGGKTKGFLMHRQLLGFPDGLDVHHKNHNTLDNQRENLEAITHRENLSKRVWKKSKSGIHGVYFVSSIGLWRMDYVKQFDNPVDAGNLYRAIDEFVKANFPDKF